MNNKITKILIISGIIITTICAMIGFSYAYLRTQVIGNDTASNIITNLGALELTFSDGQYINNTNIDVGWTQSKTVTVKNTGNETLSYYLIWEELTNTFVNKELLTYTVTNAGEGASLATTQIPNTGQNIQILPQTSIPVGVTHAYTITFNYENSSLIDQSSDMNKILAGKLKVVEEIPPILLVDAIKRDNPEYITQIVQNDTMFESAATTDMGLWTENRVGKTEDDLPVYFYRGDIENNYVSFAGKMWRIVRINEDGTVKLILGGNDPYDGIDNLTKYNTYSNLSDYVDYNHANNALKAANNRWYSSYLTSYESYISNTKFCNDKSIVLSSGSYIYYGAYIRLNTNKTPQYKCPNASDNYIYKIGALTADEVAYAGGLSDIINESYYLYDNAIRVGDVGHWWLLSPAYFDGTYSRTHIVCGPDDYDGSISLRIVSGSFGYRPVISLKSDTLVTGSGVLGDAYVVQ